MQLQKLLTQQIYKSKLLLQLLLQKQQFLMQVQQWLVYLLQFQLQPHYSTLKNMLVPLFLPNSQQCILDDSLYGYGYCNCYKEQMHLGNQCSIVCQQPSCRFPRLIFWPQQFSYNLHYHNHICKRFFISIEIFSPIVIIPPI